MRSWLFFRVCVCLGKHYPAGNDIMMMEMMAMEMIMLSHRPPRSRYRMYNELGRFFLFGFISLSLSLFLTRLDTRNREECERLIFILSGLWTRSQPRAVSPDRRCAVWLFVKQPRRCLWWTFICLWYCTFSWCLAHVGRLGHCSVVFAIVGSRTPPPHKYSVYVRTVYIGYMAYEHCGLLGSWA